VNHLLPNRGLGVSFGAKASKLTMADTFTTQRFVFLNMNRLNWTPPSDITDNGEGWKMSEIIGAIIIGRAETNTGWNYKDGMARKSTTSQMRGAYKHAVCAFSDSRIR
jgi:hypothetical protein